MSAPVSISVKCDNCGKTAAFRVTSGANGYRCTCSCHGKGKR